MGKEGSHDSIGYLLAQVCKLSRDRSRVLMGGIGLYCGQTEEGRSLRKKVEGNWHKLEGQALAGFTEGDRALLQQLLLRIRDNLGQTKTQ